MSHLFTCLPVHVVFFCLYSLKVTVDVAHASDLSEINNQKSQRKRVVAGRRQFVFFLPPVTTASSSSSSLSSSSSSPSQPLHQLKISTDDGQRVNSHSLEQSKRERESNCYKGSEKQSRTCEDSIGRDDSLSFAFLFSLFFPSLVKSPVQQSCRANYFS